jgi:copper chaperone CopZ
MNLSVPVKKTLIFSLPSVLFSIGLVTLPPMNRLLTTVFLVVAILGAGCRKADIRTFTISVPDMKNQACVTVIVNTLMREQAVRGEDVQADLEKRTVTVKYDSLQRAQKNLVFAIAKAGFTANGVPANPDAAKALPPECR